MKGLTISAATFVLYVLFVALLCHVLRPNKHLRFFFSGVLVWTPFYFLAYFLTPHDLYFLSPAWLVKYTWLDIAYGYVVFLLNAHNYIDFFTGFNSGFSTSLLLEVLRSEPRGITTKDMVRRYIAPDGTDIVYGRRLPWLESSGYITIDAEKATCRLTPRGRKMAWFVYILKRFLNLKAGG